MTREKARREIDSLDFYLQNHTDDYSEESHAAMMMAIQALEKEPCIVHAHWIYGYTFPDGQYRKCSACKELMKVGTNDGNFCVNCGAKMEN